VVDETLEQELAHQLREIAKKIRTEALHEAAGIAGALTNALDGVISNAPVCTVVVTLGNDTVVEDWLLHPEVPPAVLYEMVGRLQAISLRLIALASHRESHEEEDGSDHTGHGCELDPTVGRPKVPSSAN